MTSVNNNIAWLNRWTSASFVVRQPSLNKPGPDRRTARSASVRQIAVVDRFDETCVRLLIIARALCNGTPAPIALTDLCCAIWRLTLRTGVTQRDATAIVPGVPSGAILQTLVKFSAVNFAKHSNAGNLL